MIPRTITTLIHLHHSNSRVESNNSVDTSLVTKILRTYVTIQLFLHRTIMTRVKLLVNPSKCVKLSRGPLRPVSLLIILLILVVRVIWLSWTRRTPLSSFTSSQRILYFKLQVSE